MEGASPPLSQTLHPSVTDSMTSLPTDDHHAMMIIAGGIAPNLVGVRHRHSTFQFFRLSHFLVKVSFGADSKKIRVCWKGEEVLSLFPAFQFS